MAPIYKKVAKEMAGKAVFVKVDTNAISELSQRYRIQSLPTFQWFLGGRKIQEEKGGIGESPLRQYTDKAIRQAESEDVKLELDDLEAFKKMVEPQSENSSSSSAPNNNEKKSRQPSPNSSKSKGNSPNLHLATKEQLLEELEKRQDDEREKEIEEEDCEEEDCLEDNESRWISSGFPENVIIVGGGPAGLASAVYAARSGLKPLVIAPSIGGQLQ